MIHAHRTRIVLLYGDTGGGHRSAAQAIAHGLRIVGGDALEIQLHNAFGKLRFPWDTVERDYPYWINYGRVLYNVGFKTTNGRRRVMALRGATRVLTNQMAESILKDAPADLYISCHPGYNQTVPPKIRQAGASSKFVNVVTDLVTGHATHYTDDVDLCIVPTYEAADIAIEHRVSPEKVRVLGQPVWPDFKSRMGHRVRTRADLGLSQDLPMVLMMGGGDGMGRIGLTAREIAFSGLPIQLVVVCGRNHNLKRDLEFVNPRVSAMRVLGFVNYVPELMGAADVLVTKAGPGTISEALIAGLPMLLFDAVPGQEDGNKEFVVKHGVGAWQPNPFLITRQIKRWLNAPDEIRQMSNRARALAHPDSAVEIAKAALNVIG